MRNLAETTQSGLQKARSEAMKRNMVVGFWMVGPATVGAPDDNCTLSATSAAWVVSVDNPAGKCATERSATTAPRIVEVYGPGQSGANLVVAAADAAGTPASSVSFNGFGQRVGGGVAVIDLSHSAGTDVRPLRIQISVSGGIRMCDPAVAAPDPRACN